MSRRLRDSRGQTSVEWLGVIVLVAVVALGLKAAAPGFANKIIGGVDDAICTVTGGDCGGGDQGPKDPPAGGGEPTSAGAAGGSLGPQGYGAARPPSDPNVDSDGDGLPDRAEKAAGTKPDKADSDGDTLTDAEEIAIGTSPTDKDSDGAGGSPGDGLTDADEVKRGTDPTLYDSDGDFMCDGCEVKEGDNPLKDERRFYEKWGDHFLDNPLDFILPGGILKSGGKGLVDGLIKKVAPKLKGIKKGMSLGERASIRRQKIAALRRALKDERGSFTPGEFLPNKPKRQQRRERRAASKADRRSARAERRRANRGDRQDDAENPGRTPRDRTGPAKSPKKLKAFPDTKPAKSKTPVEGGGKLRERWKDKDGKIYEWDSKKGALEVYDRRGKHLGEFNHKTGERIGPPIKKRTVEP